MTSRSSAARMAVGVLMVCAMNGTISAKAPSPGVSPQFEIVTFLDWAERDLSFIPLEERHAFVVRALELLAAAADVLIDRSLGSAEAAAHRRALSLRTRALAEAPDARRSALARAAFAEGAALIRALAADLPEGSAPHESRLAALERAGRAIDSTALSRQPEAIQHYFRHAVASIRILSRSTARQRQAP